MSRIYLLLLFFTAGLLLKSQELNGEALLKQLHQRFYQAGCKAYSFSQKNTHYRNDSVVGTSEWHEVIEYPDKFSIQYGDPSLGNKRILRNDSAYVYKAGSLVKTVRDSSSLLLVLGGMYFRSLEEVMVRLSKAGYNYKLASEQLWEGKKVYVIGALPGDLSSNQFWVEQSSLKIIRILHKRRTDLTDMRFEKYQDWCKGHVETSVSFYRNGKLEQVEDYYNLKVLDKFPD